MHAQPSIRTRNPALLADFFNCSPPSPSCTVCKRGRDAVTGNAYVEAKAAVAHENVKRLRYRRHRSPNKSHYWIHLKSVMFLADMGLKEPRSEQSLWMPAITCSKLTAADFSPEAVQEVRAWTIHQGDTGPEAAGVVPRTISKRATSVRRRSWPTTTLLHLEASGMSCIGQVESRGRICGEGRDVMIVQR